MECLLEVGWDEGGRDCFVVMALRFGVCMAGGLYKASRGRCLSAIVLQDQKEDMISGK